MIRNKGSLWIHERLTLLELFTSLHIFLLLTVACFHHNQAQIKPKDTETVCIPVYFIFHEDNFCNLTLAFLFLLSLNSPLDTFSNFICLSGFQAISQWILHTLRCIFIWADQYLHCSMKNNNFPPSVYYISHRYSFGRLCTAHHSKNRYFHNLRQLVVLANLPS